MGKYNDWTRGEDEALLNVIGGTDVARAVLRGEYNITVAVVEGKKNNPEPQPLLTRIGTIGVYPRKFMASKFFMVNTKKNASAKISYVGDNFRAWFFGGAEECLDASETAPGDGPYRAPGNNGDDKSVIRYYNLNRDSVDAPIIAGLGGEAKAKTTLVHIAGLMQEQANGEQGALLTNGSANMFYVRDNFLVLRALIVRWYGFGWYVDAHSVESPYEWSAGYRVFFRDS